MYENMAILAAFVFLYSIACGGLERTPINGAVVFVFFGLVLGPLGLGLLVPKVDAEALSTLAEMSLALVITRLLQRALESRLDKTNFDGRAA